jgi:hypothetical protein
MDDEGNDAGSLVVFSKDGKEDIIPAVPAPKDGKPFLERLKALLVGKKIVKAEYMPSAEAKEMGWYASPIVITLEDGTFFYPQRDDEGNDAGAYLTTFEKCETLPVIGTYVSDEPEDGA